MESRRVQGKVITGLSSVGPSSTEWDHTVGVSLEVGKVLLFKVAWATLLRELAHNVAIIEVVVSCPHVLLTNLKQKI